jgi:hypothetical protein
MDRANLEELAATLKDEPDKKKLDRIERQSADVRARVFMTTQDVHKLLENNDMPATEKLRKSISM